MKRWGPKLILAVCYLACEYLGGSSVGFLPFGQLKAQVARAQQPVSDVPQLVTNQLVLPVQTVTPLPVAIANVQLTGNPGPATYYYWLVANYAAGQAPVAGPFLGANSPNTLSGSNFNTISWISPVGAISVDVLRTNTTTAPSGACGCAVATGVTTGSANDQSNSLNAYTVNPVNLNALQISLQNEIQAGGGSNLVFRQNGASIGLNLGFQALLFAYPNAPSGTSIGSLVKTVDTSGVQQVAKTAVTDTQNAIGCVQSGAGTTGNALVDLLGPGLCLFDNSTITDNDVVIVSTTVPGTLSDGGLGPVAGVLNMGRVSGSHAACGSPPCGPYTVNLLTPDTVGSGAVANPMTTLGDLTYGSTLGVATRLPGLTGPNGVPFVLCEKPANGAATAPGWCQYSLVPNVQSGASYIIAPTDMAGGLVVSTNNASPVWTLPQAGTTGYGNNGYFTLSNEATTSSSNVVLTPTVSTITVYPFMAPSYTVCASSCTATSMSIPPRQRFEFTTDNVSYRAYQVSGPGTAALAIALQAIIIESGIPGSPFTIGNLACLVAATGKTVNCGTNGTVNANAFAVITGTAIDGNAQVAVDGTTSFLSAAATQWTAGDNVCTDPLNAGVGLDNGTTGCPSNSKQVGYVSVSDGSAVTSHTIKVAIDVNSLTGSGVPPNASNFCAVLGTFDWTCISNASYVAAQAGGGNVLIDLPPTGVAYNISQDIAPAGCMISSWALTSNVVAVTLKNNGSCFLIAGNQVLISQAATGAGGTNINGNQTVLASPAPTRTSFSFSLTHGNDSSATAQGVVDSRQSITWTVLGGARLSISDTNGANHFGVCMTEASTMTGPNVVQSAALNPSTATILANNANVDAFVESCNNTNLQQGFTLNNIQILQTVGDTSFIRQGVFFFNNGFTGTTINGLLIGGFRGNVANSANTVEFYFAPGGGTGNTVISMQRLVGNCNNNPGCLTMYLAAGAGNSGTSLVSVDRIDMEHTVGQSFSGVAASNSGGNITFTVTSPNYVFVFEQITVTGCVDSTYNGTYNGANGVTSFTSTTIVVPQLQATGASTTGCTVVTNPPIVFVDGKGSSTLGAMNEGWFLGQVYLELGNSNTSIGWQFHNGGHDFTFGHLNCQGGAGSANICLQLEGSQPARRINVVSGYALFPQFSQCVNDLSNPIYNVPCGTANQSGWEGWSSDGIYQRVLGSVVTASTSAPISLATLCSNFITQCGIAGQFRIDWNVWGTGTACGTPSPGGVSPSFTWTDENGTAHSAVIPSANAQSTATATTNNVTAPTVPFQSALANEGGGGSFVISTNGSFIQYQVAYAACGVGTGSYGFRAAVTRLQGYN